LASLQHSPRPLAALKEPTFKGRERREREREGREREGRRGSGKGRDGKGKG